jgi:hypothetical protein
MLAAADLILAFIPLPDGRRSRPGLQAALEHRNLLRLVETPPQGVFVITHPQSLSSRYPY